MSLQAKPKYLFFDWDDTLVNTKILSHKSFNQLCEYLKMDYCFSIDEVIKINSMNFEDFFKNFFAERANEAINVYREIYNKNSSILKPMDKAVDLLKELQKQKIYTGIISNKPHDLLKKEVEKFEIDEYLQFYLGSDYFPTIKKPNTDLYTLICKERNIEKETKKTAFCGDSLIDVKFCVDCDMENIFFVGKDEYIKDYLNQIPVQKKSKIILSNESFEEIFKVLH